MSERDQVLIECYRRQQVLARARRPDPHQGRGASYRAGCARAYQHDQEKRHGPRYSGPEWFGATTNTEVQRYRRAVLALEGEGLLVVGRAAGKAVTHLRLTAEGERVALALLGEPEPPVKAGRKAPSAG